MAPSIVPVIRRGKRLAQALQTSISYWSEYTMFEGSERELRFPLAVCVSYQQGKRGKQGKISPKVSPSTMPGQGGPTPSKTSPSWCCK